MFSYYQAVKQFHNATSRSGPAPEQPTLPDIDTRMLRWNLITEEYRELYDEMFGDGLTEENFANFAKELADLLYVVVGTAVACGIDIDYVFQKVHESNMSKLPVTYREDGKVLKGPNYQPPDIKSALEDLAL